MCHCVIITHSKHLWPQSFIAIVMGSIMKTVDSLSYIQQCTLDSGRECDGVSIEPRVDSCVLAEQMARHG